jgi:hypothetical protein
LNRTRAYLLALLASSLLLFKSFENSSSVAPAPASPQIAVFPRPTPFKPGPEPTCLPGKIGIYKSGHGAFGQIAPNHKLKFAILDVGVDGKVTLPENFEKRCDVIVYHPMGPDKPHFKPLWARWPDDLDDGIEELVIYSNLIILRSSHNNPNPDDLYWHTYITPVQHQAIAKFFKANLNNKRVFADEYHTVVPQTGFKFGPNEEEKAEKMTQAESQKYYEKMNRLAEKYSYKNFEFLINHFNHEIKNKADIIPLPTQKELFHYPVRLVYGLFELD